MPGTITREIKPILGKHTKLCYNPFFIAMGSTIRDFKNTKGDQGNFQKEFKVYGRDKQNCKRLNCSGTINKITQSNRSTFLCEICQK